MKPLISRVKSLSLFATFTAALIVGGAATEIRADGCYICAGQSNTYVKFTGSDNGAKRAAAKNCGCTVSGTTSSCNAANFKVLCTVLKPKSGEFKVAAAGTCSRSGS